jgi:TonB family protein
MKRILATLALFVAATAFAQEHKISVQKYEVSVYPPIARAAHISGDVKLTLDIAPDGTVTAVKVLSGHPMLVTSATDAIKKWRFHCDDCKYGEPFHHSIIFDFKIALSEDRGKWLQLPDRIVIYTEPAVIDITNSTLKR